MAARAAAALGEPGGEGTLPGREAALTNETPPSPVATTPLVAPDTPTTKPAVI